MVITARGMEERKDDAPPNEGAPLPAEDDEEGGESTEIAEDDRFDGAEAVEEDEDVGQAFAGV